MNKFTAIAISIVGAFATLILMSMLWVFIQVEGVLCYALSAAFSISAGKSVYAYLKKKYKL